MEDELRKRIAELAAKLKNPCDGFDAMDARVNYGYSAGVKEQVFSELEFLGRLLKELKQETYA